MFPPQALLAVKPVSVEEDQEPEVPTHPEDGTPQPGNSKVRRENPSMGCQWRPVRVPRQPRLMETQPGQRLSLCEARGLCSGTEWSPGWSGTRCVDKAGFRLKSTCLCFLLAGVKVPCLVWAPWGTVMF